MKDQQSWDMANRYSSILMIYIALSVMIIQIFSYILFSKKASLIASIIIMIVGVILIFPLTEKKLKK